MTKTLIEEFVAFVKETSGLTIRPVTAPDRNVFDELFGDGFIQTYSDTDKDVHNCMYDAETSTEYGLPQVVLSMEYASAA